LANTKAIIVKRPEIVRLALHAVKNSTGIAVFTSVMAYYHKSIEIITFANFIDIVIVVAILARTRFVI
jgi:hypothetical protein